ncbi:MAG: PTS transporter subunit IIC [Brooklawnia sp.]|jgi:PTS system galactitol-specific IIC component
MDIFLQIGQVINNIMSLFGAAIVVPIVILIISLVMRVDLKKSLQGALYMAVGLTLFQAILGILLGAIAPFVMQMSVNTGITKPFIDVGWQGASVIVYSNQLGYLYLVLGLGVNLLLFALKITDTFQPTDIWNYYQFVFWAIIVQFVTGSFWLGIISAVMLNLVVLLMADIMAPALQEYYGYDNVTLTSVPLGGVVGAMLFQILFNKVLKIKDREVEGDDISDRMGFWGEPMFIGLIIGLLIALLGSLHVLGDPGAWGSMLSAMLVVAGIMVIYPTVSGLFVKGLVPLSQSMQTRIRSGKTNRKFFNIALDPAVFFGDARNLTTGLILIPIVFGISLILPGNNVLMLADVPAMPFMTVPFIVAFRGNIVKAVTAGAIWFSFSNILQSEVGEAFTQAAVSAGVANQVPAVADAFDQGLGVAAWTVGTNPILWLVYKAFSVEGSLKFLTIALVAIGWLVVWFLFRRNRNAWHRAAGASQEFLDERDALINGTPVETADDQADEVEVEVDAELDPDLEPSASAPVREASDVPESDNAQREG